LEKFRAYFPEKKILFGISRDILPNPVVFLLTV